MRQKRRGKWLGFPIPLVQSLDKSLGDCEKVRHALASKGYLAKKKKGDNGISMVE